MITLKNKPNLFIPYEEITICSNKITDGGNLVAVGELLPVLIGKGDTPQIWLMALADAGKNEFIPIVERSISKHHAVKVYEEDGVVNVTVAGNNILSVKNISDEKAVVTELDLRPIGLNIHGNEDKLYVGNSSFKNTGMAGGGTLIGFGTSKSIP